MSTSAASTVEVGEYYDESAEIIEVLGGNIHVGYWRSDDDRTPLLEAINRFTDLVGDKLELRAGERLLDLGCGAAVAAIRLAQRTDADVTAVTNSTWQVEEGQRRVYAAGLRGQVRVELGDAGALGYPDRSFDAVLALESLPHAADRSVWLAEMCRVLRPGGRVVLTDLTEEIPLSEADVEVLRGSVLAAPLSAVALLDLVERAGFRVDEFLSCGEKIKRSYTAYFERIAGRRDELEAALGADKIEQDEQEMEPLLAIYQEKIGCVVVVARKSA